jgi:hypothetical protein
VLVHPNKWLTLVDYMTNPTKIKPFMAGCAAEIVGRNNIERVEALWKTARDVSTLDTLPETQEFLLCLDANGTQFEDYALCGLPISCHCMKPKITAGTHVLHACNERRSGSAQMTADKCMNALSALFLQCSLSVE